MMTDSNRAETFGSPSTIIPEEPIDICALAQAGGRGRPEELSRQSLYVKFDPLVNCTDTPERPGEATTAQTPALAAGKLLDFATPEGVRGHSATATGNLLTDTPVARRGVAFAESVSVKEVTPRKGPEAGDRLYSEADVQQKIADALKQAHQEAMIVQMETEELQKKLEAEMQNNKEMTTVVEEYSRALSDMIAQQNKTGADEAMANLKREKEQTEDDLRKTETAFSDLHAKYSKSKELMDNYRLNEQKLKETLISAQEALQASEKRYETLKGHAEAKISEANVEIANVREQYKTQINLLTVKAKKAESEIVSVRKQLEIKEVDNKELTSICDDLVKQLDALNRP